MDFSDNFGIVSQSIQPKTCFSGLSKETSMKKLLSCSANYAMFAEPILQIMNYQHTQNWMFPESSDLLLYHTAKNLTRNKMLPAALECPRYPRCVKNLPLGPKPRCAKFGQDWCTHVDVYSKHTERQTFIFIDYQQGTRRSPGKNWQP